MIEVMKSVGIDKPSKVQALSYKSLYAGLNSVVSDQTGSGKTFAYLLPTIQRMLDLTNSKQLQPVKPRSPFIIVVAPTTELATQVTKVAKKLANALKFRTACFTSSNDLDSESKKLRLGSEMLVCTPGRLLALIERHEIVLKDLLVAVLDEADILYMDESFKLQPIGENCPNTTQFIFTSATMPESVLSQIKLEFPDLVVLNGPGLHRIAPNIQEELIDCSGKKDQARNSDAVFENKRIALLKILSESKFSRTLIFCNSIEQCRNVENLLSREDRQVRVRSVLAYHGAVEADKRESNLQQFCRKLLEKPVVLICTDRASRGMDFDTAPVDHVILFDFPREPSEYIRRVGRTGRAGREGKVTVLAYGKQVEVAKTVINASIDGKKIEPE